ncbi:hypothetical protein C8R45DRAFT_190728 [Mycena sanguinolenta]|nr:hypothetical protein C8R45DRAFT_190728 [Mycena sanguinolenta]
MKDFPQELVDIIIDFVDGLESRRSCALVSRSFYSGARLFSRLEIGRKHNIAQLCELLENSPSFAAQVESLRFSNGSTVTQVDLRRPLSLLVSLTRLCIESNLPWPNISVANRDSIQAILPTLTHLELRGIRHFPMELLSHCSSLRSLRLNFVFFPLLTSDVAAYEGSLTPLQNLSLLHVTDLGRFVNWILFPESPFDISSLRSLEFQAVNDYFDPPHPLIRRLLHASAPSLQRLCLKHHERMLGWGLGLDLRGLAHLQTLSLEIYVGAWSFDREHLISLSNLVLPQQQVLALFIDFKFSSIDQRTMVVRDLTDVDHALAALPFETINITFSFRGDFQAQGDVLNVSNKFLPHLPLLTRRLGERGALRILESIPIPEDPSE